MNEPIKPDEFERFNKRSLIVSGVLSILYYSWFHLTIGLRPDHYAFHVLLVVGYYAHPISRRFVLGLSVFVVYTLLYDSHKAFPNYIFNPVHIEEPLNLEKSLFGIMTSNGILTPSGYFQQNTYPFLDVVTGLFYLCWMPVPLLLATYLTFTNRIILFQFSLAFLTVNIFGWIIYYLYPAAAPWYVDLYGFEENFNIPGNVAGLGRFDQFFGVSIFESLYTKASNVFAALPSLHSAYPVVAFVYGIKNKMGWINVFFGVVMVGIWFAAVYTNHHYVIDVLLGIIVALVGILFFEKVLMKTRFKNVVEDWANSI